MQTDILSLVRSAAKQYYKELVNIRRHLHAYPELSFQEYKTQAYLAQTLENWGIETQSIGQTGLVAILQGHAPGTCIALRADIDALPIQEENDLPYRSKNKGIMHACGHDIHTTCLLGAARILHQYRTHWRGQVKLIFQPAEEKLPGGASLLIKEGVLHAPTPKMIFGQHIEPPLEVGKIGVCAGPFMASADEIYLRIRGRGGHAARPQQCVDTVLLSAQVIQALQQVVSRHADPLMPTVLSFGKIQSLGGATNVIPDEVYIEGTLRTFDEAWRAEAKQHIQRIVAGVCQAAGGSAEVEIRHGYPFLHNDAHEMQQFIQAAKTYLGEEQVIPFPPRMGAEDFAYYSQEIPACFYRLGVRNPAQENASGLHTATLLPDERALEVGAGLMAYAALHRLNA